MYSVSLCHEVLSINYLPKKNFSNPIHHCAVLPLITQSCPTRWDPMNSSPPASSGHRDSPSRNYWSGLPGSPPGDLPNPGLEPRSPALQILDELSYQESSILHSWELICPPRKHLTLSENSFCHHASEDGTPGAWWARARDASKLPSLYNHTIIIQNARWRTCSKLFFSLWLWEQLPRKRTIVCFSKGCPIFLRTSFNCTHLPVQNLTLKSVCY